MAHIGRLGNKRLDQLAIYVCGDDGPFPYRRHVDLTAFFDDHRPVLGDWEDPDAGRFARTTVFLAVCNRSDTGESGMPVGIERVVATLLDIGEFDSTSARDDAVPLVRSVFEGYPVEVEIEGASGRLLPTTTDPRQQIIDDQFETVFGDTIKDKDLEVARLHFRKARGFLRGTKPDYENAAKEAVGSVEAYLKTLTQEQDFKKALRKAVAAGVPRPLTALIEKLYAWRGDEPGVAHAGPTAPMVERADAEFACNQAMIINKYLRERLAE
jgi:hypothetical protein